MGHHDVLRDRSVVEEHFVVEPGECRPENGLDGDRLESNRIGNVAQRPGTDSCQSPAWARATEPRNLGFGPSPDCAVDDGSTGAAALRHERHAPGPAA